eukprot:TRINITY_DN1940_c0_g1_i1.p1 TRINITY_DN1940_c0_g1~~TRINITY_DN1940_c0_g1_i1.p1  ORF type:complete len:462 (+),score=133.22 TRINITY_DN1940_c0_g1_i1:56-1441(+)
MSLFTCERAYSEGTEETLSTGPQSSVDYEQDEAWHSYLKPEVEKWERYSECVWGGYSNSLGGSGYISNNSFGSTTMSGVPASTKPSSPETVVAVVHPSGHKVWMPYIVGHSTVEMLKTEVATLYGWSTRDFQVSCANSMLHNSTFIEQVCSPGAAVYIVPRLPAMHLHAPTVQEASEFHMIAPGVVLSYEMPQRTTCPTCKSVVAEYPGSQRENVSALYNSMALDEKMAYAAQNLMTLVNNTKQCTGLQGDIEASIAQGIDCAPVLTAIETSVTDLVLHPAGNYLLSKCFDVRPALITTAAEIISKSVKKYVLHKHGSYVAEAILEHQQTPAYVLGNLIANLLSPSACGLIAAHDSGNFVLQKAISNCPDHLLPVLTETVNAALPQTPHAAKMSKKLYLRTSKNKRNNRERHSHHHHGHGHNHGHHHGHHSNNSSNNSSPTNAQQQVSFIPLEAANADRLI